MSVKINMKKNRDTIVKIMRVYISGKIGEEVISEATRLKFAQAQEMLMTKDYEVFNPCDERWQRILKREYDGDTYIQSPWLTGKFPDFYAYCLLRDLMVLSTKDAVYFLDDWDKSNGANAEYSFAVAAGKRLYFQDRHDACEYLIERMYKEAKANGSPVEYENIENRNDIEIAYFTKHIHEAWLPL